MPTEGDKSARPPQGGLRIAHVSDLHILDLTGVRPWRFVGKRATGGLNLLFKRNKAHSSEAVIRAFDQIHALNPDHIVVTGDLSNLSLESEFEAARRIITEFAGGPQIVSIIPGNHDTYTLNSARTKRFEAYFSPWMRSDLPTQDDYPYVKLIGEGLAIIGISTCVPTPPMIATGKVGPEQLERIASLLDDPALKDRFVLVAQHHHLVPPKFTTAKHERSHGLKDCEVLMEALLTGGTDLVIHGHNHQHGFTRHERPDGGTMHVCEAGSTSLVGYKNPHFGAKFNIYDLSPDAEGKLALERITTHLYTDEARGFEPWHEELAPFDEPQATNGANP